MWLALQRIGQNFLIKCSVLVLAVPGTSGDGKEDDRSLDLSSP